MEVADPNELAKIRSKSEIWFKDLVIAIPSNLSQDSLILIVQDLVKGCVRQHFKALRQYRRRF